ncbi:MAG TPA: hypothetical protein VK498_05975 [Ferruginibacter sp.]|nr:hypothetical protein [Ferruginibacter sp.]
MKQAILLPFMVLYFGFPIFIFKVKPCIKARCERPVLKQERKEARAEQSESKYNKVFSYDNIFYKI